MQRVQDLFNRADGNLTNPWILQATGGYGDLQIVSNRVRGTANDADNLDRYMGNTFDPYQYASFILAARSAIDVGTQTAAACLRLDTTGADNYYRYELKIFDAIRTAIKSRIAGADTDLATEGVTDWQVNDQLLAIVKGTTLTLLRNGAILLTANDSARSVGSTGLFLHPQTNLGEIEIDTFVAGDFPNLNDSQFPKPKISDAVARGWLY